MGTDELSQLIAAAHRLLADRLRRDEALRAFVGRLADWLGRAATDARQADTPEMPLPDAPALVETAPSAPVELNTAPASSEPTIVTMPLSAAERPSSAVVTLRIGDAEVPLRVQGTSRDIAMARIATPPQPEATIAPSSPPDLELIEQRCRLKARACRVFAQKRAASSDDLAAPLIEQIDELIRQAKALDRCFLWMVFRGRSQPDDQALATIERAYENLAHAASLMRSAEGVKAGNDLEVEAVCLLAEAQSSLRAALRLSWLDREDTDQDDAFHWLRAKTHDDQIFVGRYMRQDDQADPSAWQDLSLRLSASQQRLAGFRARHTSLKEGLGKAKYHAKRLASGTSVDIAADWSALRLAVERLSTTDFTRVAGPLRDALRPIAALVPPSFELGPVLDRLLDDLADPATDQEEPIPDEGPLTPEVLRTRELLRAKRVVLIGGERREHAAQRLEKAFELAELAWIPAREHASSSPFLPEIANPRTQLVLIAARLAGHTHLDDARSWCRQHGKPLVVLPRGYNPAQVAQHVLSQASQQLSLNTHSV